MKFAKFIDIIVDKTSDSTCGEEDIKSLAQIEQKNVHLFCSCISTMGGKEIKRDETPLRI